MREQTRLSLGLLAASFAAALILTVTWLADGIFVIAALWPSSDRAAVTLAIMRWAVDATGVGLAVLSFWGIWQLIQPKIKSP